MRSLHILANSPLVTAFIDLVNAVVPFLPQLLELGRELLPVFVEILKILIEDGLLPLIPVIMQIVRDILPLLIEIFREVLVPLLRDVVMPVIRELAGPVFELLIAVLRDVLVPVLERWVIPAIRWLVEIFRDHVLPYLRDTVVPFIRDEVVPIIRGIADVMQYVVPAVEEAFGKVRDYIVNAGTVIIEKWNAVLDWFREFVGKLYEIFVEPIARFYEAGQNLIQSFADGINSKQAAATDAAGNVMGGTAALFPQSPPKEGPFSGPGWTFYSGQELVEGFGAGIAAAAPKLADLARQALEGARIAVSQGFGSGAGGTVNASSPGFGTMQLQVAPGVDSALSSLLMNLVRTGQLQLQRAGV